uniref:C-type lectin domain-containing protein n=1 Tax=Panagrolaimus davidi TaxID=227884 RepID=A0A914QGB2_9BILA
MTPGNWSWTDDTTFDFKDWAPKEPQNLSMNCAALAIQNGYWASSDCFKTKPYVCEISATPSYPAYMNCTEGWVYFEPTHSCYGHDGYSTQTGTWTVAENYCQKQSAHLPSLHSYDEARFLSTTSHFIGNAFLWTGLYSNDNEVSWKWSDRSPVDYHPWGSGYPKLNVSSCAYLYNNAIYDTNCSSSLYFVCKKPAFP